MYQMDVPVVEKDEKVEIKNVRFSVANLVRPIADLPPHIKLEPS